MQDQRSRNEEAPGKRRRRKSTWLVVSFVLLTLLLTLEWQSFRGDSRVLEYPDTNVYRNVANSPLLSRDFLLAPRPIATSLLHKSLGGVPSSIAFAQSLLSVVCWFVLGLVLASRLEHWPTRMLAACLSGLFSLVVPLNQWDRILLSESLSFSALALTLAVSLLLVDRLVNGPPVTRKIAVAWLLACGTLALARDSNLYLLAVLWVFLAGWLGVSWLRSRVPALRPRGSAWTLPEPAVFRNTLILLAALALLLVVTQSMSRASQRWQSPLINVMLQRVLTNDAAHAELVEKYGMPRNTEFERYAGRRAWTRTPFGEPIRERFWARDPAVEDIRIWLYGPGLVSYARYLILDHPVSSIRRMLGPFSSNVNSRYTEQQYGKGLARKPWTEALTRVLYWRVPRPLLVWGCLLLLSLAAAVLLPTYRVLAVGAFFLALNAFAQAFITFHGDTSNVVRHMGICGVLLRLSAMVLMLILIDALAVRFFSRLESDLPE